HQETFQVHQEKFQVHDEKFQVRDETFQAHDEKFQVHDETFVVHDETFQVRDETFVFGKRRFLFRKTSFLFTQRGFALDLPRSPESPRVYAKRLDCRQLSAAFVQPRAAPAANHFFAYFFSAAASLAPLRNSSRTYWPFLKR
ncbi:MAG: hypothetical protein QOH21_3856, partial [Acidobacteriota bacterium]|nr:hypothetical protein [Acidobacteriota bacterium]